MSRLYFRKRYMVLGDRHLTNIGWPNNPGWVGTLEPGTGQLTLSKQEKIWETYFPNLIGHPKSAAMTDWACEGDIVPDKPHCVWENLYTYKTHVNLFPDGIINRY